MTLQEAMDKYYLEEFEDEDGWDGRPIIPLAYTTINLDFESEIGERLYADNVPVEVRYNTNKQRYEYDVWDDTYYEKYPIDKFTEEIAESTFDDVIAKARVYAEFDCEFGMED